MAKEKKIPRPQARTVRGFRDDFGVDVIARAEMLEKISKIYNLYGFDALETGALETVEALGKFLPDLDRPNEGVMSMQDENGEWLALRYDMTAPLARVYAQYRNDLPLPYRRYAMGPVWRNEKPGPGRFRQFYQCDADTVGTSNIAADAEICMMLADVLENIGIRRQDYMIRLNQRKILNGVMDIIGLSGDEKEMERGIVLRAIDKLDRLGLAGVRDLLGEGRRDKSGDFTKGANLDESQCEKIMMFVNAKEYSEKSGQSIFDFLGNLVQDSRSGMEGIVEINQVISLLEKAGYDSDRVMVDPSTVRGLGYYTGLVYEAELTFDVKNEKGQNVQFGSIAGGGRYDDLIKRFTNQEIPATGVSIGVDRLLRALYSQKQIEEKPGPVIITVMDRDRMADYQAMVSELRMNGIRAEIYLGNPKNFGNQMKYADKRNSPIAIIEGGDEKSRGVVQVKDLYLGAKIAETATQEEWAKNPSQYEVPRSEMINKIKEILNQ